MPEEVGRLVQAVRKKEKKATIDISFEDGDERLTRSAGVVRGIKAMKDLRYEFSPDNPIGVFWKNDDDAAWTGPGRINAKQEITTAQNIYFPFLSQRKSSTIDETLNLKVSQEVRPDFKNMYARLQPLLDSGSEFHDPFMSACEDILRFRLHSFASNSGMMVGLRVDNDSRIALTEMGEGVLNILGILINIFSSDRRIFLIEELENDLHPGALKKLLAIILKNIDRHQFFISTHSSVTLRYLSAHSDTKIFEITPSIKNRIPTSVINVIENLPENTLQVANRLGIDFNDSWLFDGYLILEESSAESVIKEILIPHFVPSLEGRLRTVASRGAGDLYNKYSSSQSLFLFAHLSPIYKTRCWVRADSDHAGKEAIDKLRRAYSAGERVFEYFSKACFEYYYPACFTSEVERVLSVPDENLRREEKAKLLKLVLKWARDNRDQAREQFAVSAGEVIADLKYMAGAIMGQT